MKKLMLLFFTIWLLCPACVCRMRAEASEGTDAVTATRIPLTSMATAEGDWTDRLDDNSYETAIGFDAGDVMTLTADEPFSSLYIEWARVPAPWTLTAGDTVISCGENGFLHEYVETGTPVTSVTLSFPSDCRMANLRAYGEGTPPADVQIWNPPCEKADFLVFSTHADDEILFLGGVLATYAGARGLDVQVAYMIDFTEVMPVREHEKLDGLWTIGVRHYPVNGAFLNDDYSTALDAARASYSYDAVCAYTTEAVRRFKPLVVVTQDFNGEYGHGAHQLLAAAVADAVKNSADATWNPDSATRYDAYDVPKAYFHLYPENAIRLDLRQPIDAFGDMNAVEIAKEAYKKHVSQQWMDFYVSDDSNDTNKYAPKGADFGLYRSTVGADTGNDMTENIVPYREQAERAAQAAEEQLRAEEEERVRREQEAQQKAEQERLAAEQAEQEALAARRRSIIRYSLIGAAALIALIVLALVFKRHARRNRRRRNRRVKSFTVQEKPAAKRTKPPSRTQRVSRGTATRHPRKKNRNHRGY
ncbi:MAG: PIG-L family deacetylase [Lachnospiraceae bacterium]|nr:PIG-L family deacetylase [Lachnospiraceae bacterium]